MKRPITIISSISSLLFLVAIIWFGAGIYIDKKSGGDKAQNRYENLLNATKSALSEARFGNPDFSAKFIRAIGNIEDFSTLKLEINDELVYSYPPKAFSLPSADLVKHFEEEVYLDSGKHFKLTASIYLMKPNSIYNYAKIAFLLILVGTIIVVVLIILTNGTDDAIIRSGNYSFKKRDLSEVYRPFAEEAENEKSVNEKKEPKKEPKKEHIELKTEKESANKPFFNPETLKNEGSEEPSKASPAKIERENPESKKNSGLQFEEISISFPDNEHVHHEGNVNDWFVDSVEENEEGDGLDIIDQLEQQNAEDSDFFDEMEDDEPIFEAAPVPVIESEPAQEPESEPEPISEPVPEIEPEQAPASSEQKKPAEKQKIISHVTGLLIQSELEPSIDEEIAKGKSNLTVALVKINSLDRGNSISTNIVEILKKQTSSLNPEFFEYKSDSYAIVLSETDLQTTVDLFEEIYNKLSDYLKDNNSANEVSIGISSVANRKIMAERLLLEASQALEYASGDPDSPIVAFRANPEKYREMEEEQ